MNWNGYKSYETWNVALYICNDFTLYQAAKVCKDYKDFLGLITENGYTKTPDGVSYKDEKLFIEELNEVIKEIQ